jgi:hypothetical protein
MNAHLPLVLAVCGAKLLLPSPSIGCVMCAGDVILAGSEDFTMWMWLAQSGNCMQVRLLTCPSMTAGWSPWPSSSVAHWLKLVPGDSQLIRRENMSCAV